MSLIYPGASDRLRVITVDETSGFGVVPESSGGNLKTALVAWNTSTLSFVKLTTDVSGNLNVTGGGGGGGAVTIADGSDAAEGNTADAAIYGDVSGTMSAKLRGINAMVRGLGTALAPASASVTGSSTQVLAANANRKKLVIVNIGSVNVFFGDGFAAAMNSGIVLTPNGTWVMDRYTFTTNALYAICSASSVLSIQEYE